MRVPRRLADISSVYQRLSFKPLVNCCFLSFSLTLSVSLSLYLSLLRKVIYTQRCKMLPVLFSGLKQAGLMVMDFTSVFGAGPRGMVTVTQHGSTPVLAALR